MQILDKTLPVLPFTYAQWLEQTGQPAEDANRTQKILAMTRPASPELVALNLCIENYTFVVARDRYDRLIAAFEKWKRLKEQSYENWSKSKRNISKKGSLVSVMQEIFGESNYLKYERKTRETILMFLSKLECSESSYQFITDGVIDNLFDFANNAASLQAQTVASSIDAAGRTFNNLNLKERVLDRLVERTKSMSAKDVLQLASRPLPAMNQALVTKVTQFVEARAKSIEEFFRAEFGQPVRLRTIDLDERFEKAGQVQRNLTKSLVTFLCPIVGAVVTDSFDVIDSLLDTAAASLVKIEQRARERKISIKPGISQMLASTLRKEMTSDIAEGVYNIAKTSGKLAVDAKSAALASPVYSIILSALEILWQMIRRHFQIQRMNQMFRDAQALYQKKDVLTLGDFNSWFSDSISRTPAVAAVILNSGILVDKVSFYQLIKDDAVVDQSVFDAAVAHLQTLIEFSSEYLEQTGFEISSTVPEFEIYLQPAKRAQASGLARLISGVQAGVGAE